MIGVHENDAGLEFLDWASLFSGELFVKLAIYIDESGTYEEKCQHIVFGGLIAGAGDWANFCRAWEIVLKKYKADYFHFIEWSDASQVVRGKRRPSSDFVKTNPYKHLSNDDLDNFLIDLARILNGVNSLYVGNLLHPNLFIKDIGGRLRPEANIMEFHAHHLFISVKHIIELQSPTWKNLPISFFFDQTTHKDWKHAIINVFDQYRLKNKTYKEYAFAGKKDRPHFPLQAADMMMYRSRQISENFDAGERRRWQALDSLIFKSTPRIGKTNQELLDRIGKELDNVVPENSNRV
jgi:hypothetical protein